jgi:hypothetical protein
MNTIKHQKGLSFTGFIMVAFLFVVVAIFTLKMMPVYLDNAKVQKAFDAIVRDPALQGATSDEIKNAYYNRSTIDSITAVNVQNIEIYKENGQLYISAKYDVKIPLFGNATLLLQFHPSAPQK